MADAGIRVRAYNVGLGDCFLVTFPDGDQTRNMLIDFGCAPNQSELAFNQIVENIFEETNGHLDVIVLSHAHIDHVGGFLSRQSMFDKFVVDQVWMGLPSKPGFIRSQCAKTMRRVLEQAAEFHAANRTDKATIAQSFETLVLNNLETTEPIDYVRKLPAKKSCVKYLKRGDTIPNNTFSQNVEIEVLAPESDVSLYYEDSDEDDYDLISDLDSVCKRLDSRLSEKNKKKHPIFSNGDYKNVSCVDHPKNLPSREWRLLRKQNLNFGVQEMRALDCAINNTSLVLLLKINGKTLLFPGDAEATSWYWIRYCPACAESDQEHPDCPECKRIDKSLVSVDFFKLSDHGSKSGSPRDLIDRLSPSTIVMVSKKDNVYGTKHPKSDPGLLSCLKEKHKTNLISTDGDRLWVDAKL